MIQISPDELKRLFPHASAGCLAANSPPVGAVEASQPEPDAASPLVRPGAQRKGRKKSMVVRITLFGIRARILDEDNFVGGCKPLRDAIAASFGVDDADPRIEWRYAQSRVPKPEGVIVMIERLP